MHCPFVFLFVHFSVRCCKQRRNEFFLPGKHTAMVFCWRNFEYCKHFCTFMYLWKCWHFTDIETRGNGQIGKKGFRQKKGMLGKLANIDVSAQHVADMSTTFPTKLWKIWSLCKGKDTCKENWKDWVRNCSFEERIVCVTLSSLVYYFLITHCFTDLIVGVLCTKWYFLN